MALRLASKRTVVMVVGVAVLALVGAGAAIATSDDVTEEPITGSALARAERAALDETGGGVVTATEVNDEDSKYEVEVSLVDGSQVDVQLDEAFVVVGTKDDSEEEGDS